MQTIGLLGGMSWKSTLEYYRLINQEVQARLGGLNSAPLLLVSFNFAELVELQEQNKRSELARIIGGGAYKLEEMGADLLLICSNTMHMVADELAAGKLPLFHIADALVARMAGSKIKRLGLLGTSLTMEGDFYLGAIHRRKQMEILLPEREDRLLVNDIIFQELCCGVVSAQSRKKLLKVCERLSDKGAQAILLACTELPLLIKEGQLSVPVYNSMEIHARAAVEIALTGGAGQR
ncbi:MAG: amino acid racemase [Halanaerobium sp.]|nr:amino acid racemase [Halanaerobium sp.]